MKTLKFSLRPVLELTDEKFYQVCQANRDLRLERAAQGEIVIMPPRGETGARNASLTVQLWLWNQQNCLGKTREPVLP